MFFTSINPSFSLLLCVFIDYVSFTSHCEPTRGLDLPCTLTYIGVETAMLACKQSDLRQCGWFVNSPEFLIFCLFITPQSSHTDTRTVYITKYKRSQKNSTELFCSVLFCSVLQPSSIRGLATPWMHFLHLSLSSVILIDSSTGSPVQVLMLSIQAVRGLPRLRAPGIVPCIISVNLKLGFLA